MESKLDLRLALKKGAGQKGSERQLILDLPFVDHAAKVSGEPIL